jgi:radial spoke head protein 4A
MMLWKRGCGAFWLQKRQQRTHSSDKETLPAEQLIVLIGRTMTSLESSLRTPGADGSDLFRHLSLVCESLVKEKPQHVSPDVVSQHSVKVKFENLAWSDPLRPAHNPVAAAAASQIAAYFRKSKPLADRNGRLVQETAPVNVTVADFGAQSELLSWSGVGLGRELAGQITASLHALAALHPEYKSVRFWGRIFGVQKDYFIAEGYLAKHPKPKFSRPAQPGLWQYASEKRDVEKVVHHNRYRYHVCNRIGEAWVLLPDVLYSQILSAQKIKKLVSGDLGAAVASFPIFQGTEANYLRAQIARISAEALFVPSGHLAKNDAPEGQEDQVASIDPSPEFGEGPGAEALADAGGWAHAYPPIPADDTIPDPPGEGEEEEPAPLPEIELGGAQESEKIVCKASCPSYEHRPVVHCSSLSWPGALAASCGSAVAWIYLGYGSKRQQGSTGVVSFCVQLPPKVMEDAKDVDEKDDLKLQLDIGQAPAAAPSEE